TPEPTSRSLCFLQFLQGNSAGICPPPKELGWGGGGRMETVLGTLGKRKLVLLKYVDGNYTNYMQNRMRFHKSNFSLEILNTNTNLFLLPLSLSLEPVSDASIHVLSWALANGSCTVTLNCTAARGDDVFYSWNSWDTSTSGLCSGSGSLLHFSYPLQNTSIACTCTANNSISSQVVTFNFSECSYEQGGKFPVADSALCSLLVLFLKILAAHATQLWVTLGPRLVADPLPSLSPVPDSTRLRVKHLVVVALVVVAVVVIAALMFIRVKTTCLPIGECHEGGVLGVAGGPWVG
uniref:Ig-like domain-containing protein n=1 Tax=Otus sunia TaxID=257818 RepID=A0A8C8AZU4_9STRI